METAKTGQKIVESNGQSWLLVEVQEDASDFQLLTKPGNVDFWKLPETDHVDLYANGILNTPIAHLPYGNSYTLYGKGDQLSEEQWREIVEMLYENVKIEWDVIEEWIYGNIYKDYSGKEEPIYVPSESGKSWLTHHGFKPNGCVILKVVK